MMDAAKAVASSPHPLSKEDLYDSFDRSKRYISDVISQCSQLGLTTRQDGLYISSDEYRDLIKRSERKQLYLALRKALHKSPPFLLYIDLVTKGYSSYESAMMTKGIFRIETNEKVVERSFRNRGHICKTYKD